MKKDFLGLWSHFDFGSVFFVNGSFLMAAVRTMQMTGGGMPAPMGGQMGMPPGIPAPMPNIGPQPQPPQPQPQSGGIYGGTSAGRANLKNYMAERKLQFMENQRMQQQRQAQETHLSAPPIDLGPFGGAGGMMDSSEWASDWGSTPAPLPARMRGGGIVSLFKNFGYY